MDRTAITRRNFMKSTFAGLGTLAGTAGIQAAVPERSMSRRPNFLVVITDDQRWDAVGCAGNPIIHTPVIDGLAENGAQFKNAFVTSPICAASRASTFTGLYERTHGYNFGTPPLKRADSDMSYPLLMKRAGYRTGFVGKFGIQVAKGVEREMFDYFENMGRKPYLRTVNGTQRHLTEIMGDKASAFLADCIPDQPFCLSVSFHAPHAEDDDPEQYCLLGPNGAGKTTLIRILVTLLEPTEGSVKIDGLDIIRDRGKIRYMLGYLPQEFRMFSRLKTWEFLDYSAQLAGIRNSRERRESVSKMLEAVGLFEARDRQANKLSGGMKRRLGIAQALIGNPRILVVDEPTIGLDPEERLRFRNLLADMSREERIIILSTHIVGDISSTCEHMVMLDRGEVIFYGPPEQLIEHSPGHVWLIDADNSEVERIKEKCSVIAAVPSKHGLEVQVVCDNLEEFSGRQIEPNLEHAYVYFLEKRASKSGEFALAEEYGIS